MYPIVKKPAPSGAGFFMDPAGFQRGFLFIA
jgi:hypothetical protein